MSPSPTISRRLSPNGWQGASPRPPGGGRGSPRGDGWSRSRTGTPPDRTRSGMARALFVAEGDDGVHVRGLLTGKVPKSSPMAGGDRQAEEADHQVAAAGSSVAARTTRAMPNPTEDADDAAAAGQEDGLDEELPAVMSLDLWLRWPCGSRSPGSAPLTETSMMFMTPMPPTRRPDRGDGRPL